MTSAVNVIRLVAVLLAVLCHDALSAAVDVPTPLPLVGDVAAGDVLAPPTGDGPAVVRARFALRNVNDIDDEAETFEFTGVLVLTWHDPRQSFDPTIAGVAEKYYQGEYQFNELSPAWYPQVVLANESGLYEKNAVLLRILPDGTSTLIETIAAVAEAKLNLRRLPFDKQALEAVFEVVGFDDEEVRLEVEVVEPPSPREFRIPQWKLVSTGAYDRIRPAPELGAGRSVSQFVLKIDVARQSLFLLRLVVFPLALIVVLSWSVFWMDRSSLGDRMSTSFVGILTAVAYQIVVADLLPDVSYITLLHAFLTVSLLAMAVTVPVNLIVGAYDKAGNLPGGDALDRRCRWMIPLAYFGLNAAMLAVAMAYF